MKAIVAERGQVTIPKILRLKLGIRPGTVLDFEIHDSTLVVAKMDDRDSVAQVYGCLGKPIHTNKIINELRGKK